MNPFEQVKMAWHSIPMEVLKGNIEGHLLKVTNPKRHEELSKIRLPYSELLRQKKELLNLLGNTLGARAIKPDKIVCRIKTIGSIDRSEKYFGIMFPDKKDEFLKEDFLGLIVVVSSRDEGYKVLDALKAIGDFPNLKHKKNPRDHFLEPGKARGTDVVLKDRIHGNLSIEGMTPIHVMILSKEAYKKEILDRGQYKKSIKKIIKEAERKRLQSAN